MPARRLALILLVLLGLLGAYWAATKARFVSGGEPAAERPEQVGARNGFETAVGDSPDGRSVIDYARIDERLRRLIEKPNMVGLAVGIIEDGEIRFLQGYGTTASDREEQVTVDTVFRWASLSKGVAGDMVALLAHERRLALFDPINRWASSLRLPRGAEERATVSDVLTHRLGLFSHAQDSKLEDGYDPRWLRATLSSLHLICPPGQCHAYQNVAYDAATEIVERVTGLPYREVVRDRLFAPLGMTSASMTRAGLIGSPSWARPHAGGRNGRPVEVAEAYYRVPAAGGVNSSIKDLALWMRAQMGLAPDVLPQQVLETIQEPRAATPGENRRRRRQAERIGNAYYGLGWRIYDYAGRRVVGHRGGVRGYRSLILFDPARRTGVVALWNSSAAQPGGLEFEVMDMLYGLPFHDWLQLDSREGAPVTPVEVPENGIESTGP
ncbi:MAG TPA: serine hydrolase domain-containing protein [Allosphingosinicella sp.]|nr:serine hydrolase domain-containing protein [Allosphingosinicella sp.]